MMRGENWKDFDTTKPTEAVFYEWMHLHKLGFKQRFFAKMRVRGAGLRNVLSPEFDRWDGYRVNVPKGMKWRAVDDQDFADRQSRKSIVVVDGLALRPCPFCGTQPSISASQCGYPGGGNGVVISPSPTNLNTWRVEMCCGLIGFNGFSDPKKLAEAWNGPSLTGSAHHDDQDHDMTPLDQRGGEGV
jgi:hypothetical protein